MLDEQAAQAVEAERNRHLAELFGDLRPYVPTLLAHASAGIEAMPPARHHAGWHLLVSDLAHAADVAVRILEEHPTGQDTAACDARLWPYLRTWGEHDVLLRDLALQPAHPPRPGLRLTGEEQEWWTARARAARSRDLLQPQESRYDATGRQLTVAVLPYPDEDEEVALILAGDIDSPHVQVLGCYDTDDEAIQDLPPPVPPGVLFPGGHAPTTHALSGFPLAQLTRDVIEAQHSASVAEAISYVTDQPPHAPAGHIAQLTEFLDTCATWAAAMDTRAGHEIAVRLRILAAQTGHLLQDLTHVGGQLEEAVAVLPPHRTPAPRHLAAPRPPAVTTTPMAAAPPVSTTSAHRR
ncbi:hypothetical protein ACFQL8_19410 [Streptomyces goshikiensis]|uniref:hypothetical protein n=1 Tax=Streptomyces goshikiensis TaxID=1942 RepID=UPI0016781C62|nr:hypothetical protein [Streptomyces goshikiensis]GHD79452.1 hypothetical protein GCM10010336_61530 [Streptomyces goshikiensis]